MTTGNGVQKMKAGDTVWHHPTQQSVSVAAVDDEAGEFAPNGLGAELWFKIGDATIQTPCEFFAHRRMLITWCRDKGRRGVVSRRVLATLWSEGKLSTKGSTPT